MPSWETLMQFGEIVEITRIARLKALPFNIEVPFMKPGIDILQRSWSSEARDWPCLGG
jgi:hypothetical protein